MSRKRLGETRENLRVGLIGYGSIGRKVGGSVARGEAGRCELTAVLVRQVEKVSGGELPPACRVTGDAADFLATAMHVVVEVAGHEALKA